MESVMLTPQAIKDQEFQVKFRGYDAIEVKSYLELLAEDFFDLLEQNRVHKEAIESLVTEQEKFEDEVRGGQEDTDESNSKIQEECKQKDEEIEKLKVEGEELKESVANLEEENSSYIEKIAELEEQSSFDNEAMAEEEKEIAELRKELQLVEEKNEALVKEELDFKKTIVAAQSFADNLRQTSEQEARTLVEEAKVEVKKLRGEANAELSRLPKEIEELQLKKIQVHDELKALLHSYMEKLDDSSDLFQSIQLPDGEDMDQDKI